MSMKSCIAVAPQKIFHYNMEIFKAISSLGFRYYTNGQDGIVLMWRGKWKGYQEVADKMSGKLPELKWEWK